MALKDDLKKVFDDMKGDVGDKDKHFRTEVDKIIKKFAEGCTLTVVPPTLVGADTGPSGTFTGAATVKWKFAGGKVAKAIEDITKDMQDQKKGDDDLAQAFGDGLDKDKPQWTASLSGNTLVPGSPPVTSPSSDSGTITSTFQSAPVVTALKAAFKTMKQMTNDGDDPDDVFATALATAVTTYYTTGIHQGKGASHLAGVQFTVVVAPGA